MIETSSQAFIKPPKTGIYGVRREKPNSENKSLIPLAIPS
jgi:hypothetical protein